MITTESSEGVGQHYMGSLGTDEEEDDYDELLMKDPPSGWDIFDDYHKFE